MDEGGSGSIAGRGGVWVLNGIAASGRTLPGKYAVRTRKYQMGISRNLSELNAVYNVYGFRAVKNENNEISGTWPYGWKGEWEKFQVGSNYDAFLINLK